MLGAPLRSPLRWLAAAAALTAAASHVPITRDHLHEALYIGVLFIVLEVACVVLTGLLARQDSKLVWVGVMVTGGLAVVAYVVSRSIGLPLIKDDIGAWTDPLGYVALVSESAMVVLGGFALRGLRPVPHNWRAVPALAGAAALALGLVMTDLAAMSSPEMSEGAGAGNPPAVTTV